MNLVVAFSQVGGNMCSEPEEKICANMRKYVQICAKICANMHTKKSAKMERNVGNCLKSEKEPYFCNPGIVLKILSIHSPNFENKKFSRNFVLILIFSKISTLFFFIGPKYVQECAQFFSNTEYQQNVH